MIIDFANLDLNLELKNGIWYSGKHSEISYPEEANDACFILEENSFWFKHRNNCLIEIIKQFSPQQVLFDIGGGNGYVATGLERAGISTVLIEPGPKGVINAQKRGLSNIICSTLEDTNFKNETMNAIGIFDVLEHIKDDVAFLKLLHTYLKPGGKLYITVPAFNFLWSKEDESAGHYRRYTLKSLEKILNETGFATLYSTYIFSFLPLAVFLFRTLPGRLGLNKNPKEFKKHQQAHSDDKGIINRIYQKILKWELKKIRNRKKIPIGGSCFFTAQR